MIYEPFGDYPLHAANMTPYDVLTTTLLFIFTALAIATLITLFNDPYYADFLRSLLDHGDCTGCL